MASKIKVDTLETGDGTGSITLNNPIIGTGLTISSSGHEVTKIHRNIEVQTFGYRGTRLEFGANYNGSAVYPVSITGVTTNTGTAGWLSTEMDGVEVLRIMGDGRGLSQFTAKAWVNFNGTFNGDMTVANNGIRDEHNVSSITDIGTGQYKLNFSNAMANANYSIFGSAIGNAQSYGFITTTAGANRAPTTSGFECMQIHHNGSNTDADYIHLMVFGD